MSNYTYISATAQIKTQAGKLKGIFVSNAASTPTITIYDTFDGTTSGTTLVGVYPNFSHIILARYGRRWRGVF